MNAGLQALSAVPALREFFLQCRVHSPPSSNLLSLQFLSSPFLPTPSLSFTRDALKILLCFLVLSFLAISAEIASHPFPGLLGALQLAPRALIRLPRAWHVEWPLSLRLGHQRSSRHCADQPHLPLLRSAGPFPSSHDLQIFSPLLGPSHSPSSLLIPSYSPFF